MGTLYSVSNLTPPTPLSHGEREVRVPPLSPWERGVGGVR